MNKIFVCTALLLLSTVLNASSQTVTLDTYFNHEFRKTKSGLARFHYLWNDDTDSGFSKLGSYFTKAGFELDTLGEPPTASKLKKTSVYIIVDPDSKKESIYPKYITTGLAEEISRWVKKGGILMMMANDSANVNLTDLNLLADKFGLYFNDDMPNHVINDEHFSDGGAVYINEAIFPSKPNVFLKDACSITLNNPTATAVIKSADESAVIAAMAVHGKGVVFAVGDPWLYNEYLNGRLPASFQNDIAAKELINWLKKQSKINR